MQCEEGGASISLCDATLVLSVYQLSMFPTGVKGDSGDVDAIAQEAQDILRVCVLRDWDCMAALHNARMWEGSPAP